MHHFLLLAKILLPEPFLAESISGIDSKSFKVKLRDNLSFHNGTPLKPRDVVYTYKSLIFHTSPHPWLSSLIK